MSIVVVVKKGNEIAIASDTLSSNGAQKFSSKYKLNSKKFFKYKGSHIGSVGKSMSKIMLKHALTNQKHTINFNGYDNVYSSMLELHKLLKDKYYLVPGSKKLEQAVESTKLHLLIANKSGIYEVSPNRFIAELTTFWAIGSGASYALGAMHHAYNKKKYSAKDIAKIGVKAACEFDKSCALPMDIETIKLK